MVSSVGNNGACFAGSDPNSSYCVSKDNSPTDDRNNGYTVSHYQDSQGGGSQYSQRDTDGGSSSNYGYPLASSRGLTNSHGLKKQTQLDYEPSNISVQQLTASILKLGTTSDQHKQSVRSLATSSRSFQEGINSLKDTNSKLRDLLAAHGDKIKQNSQKKQPTITIDTLIDAIPSIGPNPKGMTKVKITADLAKRLNSTQPGSATQKIVCSTIGTITKIGTQVGLTTLIGITTQEAAPLAIAFAQPVIKVASDKLGDAAQHACHKVANSMQSSTPAKPQITAAKSQVPLAKPQEPAAKPPVLTVTRSTAASSKTAPVATKSTAAPAKIVPATK